jgi:hypothetical protein
MWKSSVKFASDVSDEAWQKFFEAVVHKLESLDAGGLAVDERTIYFSSPDDVQRRGHPLKAITRGVVQFDDRDRTVVFTLNLVLHFLVIVGFSIAAVVGALFMQQDCGTTVFLCVGIVFFLINSWLYVTAFKGILVDCAGQAGVGRRV